MSKIKFLKVSSFYPEYLGKLYRENPELKDSPYVTQYQKMMEQGIGWADYWVINLNKTGEFEAELIIINNEHAQKKWALENNFQYTEENWMLDIITEQTRRFSPDLFFANDYTVLNNRILYHIRKNVPSIKCLIGWDGVGLLDAERFRACDVMMSCNTRIAQHYEDNGFRKAFYFPFAFEKTLLDKIKTGRQKYKIGFSGSLTLRKGGHHQRLKLLGKVARNFKVDYWLSSFDDNKTYLLKNILLKTKAGAFTDVYDILNLWRISKGNVFGLDMYQTMADSEITLNNHIDTAYSFGGNIRLWEATGVGTCLVTDWKDNMNTLFEPDKEVVVFRSPEECVEKIKYLQNHPSEMRDIAAAGHKRTLEQYSYERRIKDIVVPVLKSLL